MDLFIAVSPVRFDREYVTGETIPNVVIDPKIVNRLIEWKKIVRLNTDNILIELPEVKDKPDDKMNEPDTDFGSTVTTVTQPGYECEICGRILSTKSALTNHMKTHSTI